MFGKDKKAMPAGAKDKLALAKKMREDAAAEMLAKGGSQPQRSQTVPVTLIFGLAVIAALLLTDGGNNPFAGKHWTGIYALDNLLGSKTVPALTGNADMDRLAVVFIRGFAFFLATGFIPFLSFLFLRVVDKNRVNPLVVCWGAGMALLLFFYVLGDSLLAMIQDLL